MKAVLEKSFITYEYATTLIKAAIIHAKKINITICVAVVDPVGDLVALARMDECCLIGIGTSQSKAYTAAVSGMNTRELSQYFKENEVCISSLQGEKLMFIAGGIPIIHEGKLIGAIGIGGGTGAQDEECAQAALDNRDSKC